MESIHNTKKSLNILLVEDNPGDVYLIKDIFKHATERFTIFQAANLTEAIRSIKEQPFDTILLDLGLPESIGLETLRGIDAQNLKVPIIILTGLDDEEVALESLKEGAQDYLVKNRLSYDNISHSIKYSIERKKLQEVQKRHTFQFRTLSAATTAMNESEDIPSVYTAVCINIKKLLTDAAFVCFGVTTNNNGFYVDSVGLEPYFDTVKQSGGKYLHLFKHQVADDSKAFLKSLGDGTFHEVKSELDVLAIHNSSYAVVDSIKKFLNPDFTYAISLKRGESYYGGALLFTKIPVNEDDINIIEAICNQATLNIHRRVVENELIISEKRYKGIFREAPIPKTEENYSLIKIEIDKLIADGVKDLKKYLNENKGILKDWISGIRITDLNPAVLHFFNAKTREQFLSKLDVVFSEGTYSGFIEEFVHLFEGEHKFDLEKVLYTVDGEKKDVLIRWTVAEGYEQTLERTLISVIDLTEIKKTQESLRKLNEELEQKVEVRTKDLKNLNKKLQFELEERMKAEAELVRLNRTLAALGKSSQAMMYSEVESKYLYNVCKIIVEDCGHQLVWIGYAQDDEAKTVKPIANYGFEEGYLEQLNITWADTELGHGPTGKAIRTGKPSICKNILTDPEFEPWRNEALIRGYASSLVIPLIIGGKTIGALNIYSKETDPFTEPEIALLNEIAADLVHGITTIRLKEYEKISTELIKESEENYHKLFEFSAIPIWKEDFSEIKIFFDQLKNSGITDFGKYFEEHPEDVVHLASLVKVVEINHKSIEFYGAENKEDVIKSMLFYFNDDSLDVFREELIALASGEKHFEGEMPMRTLSGDIKILDLHLSVVKGFEDTLSNILVSFIDITDRKNFEENLIRSRKEWIETFDLIPDMITILDNDHRIVRANKASNERLGGLLKKAEGLHCYECVHGQNHPPANCPHALMLKDGLEHIEDIYEQKLGAELLVSVTPIHDDDGNIIGSVHIARDITERKRFENKLKEKNEELLESNATKDKFFKIIAHDMKNPFISILGASELLRENAAKYDVNKIADFAGIINDSAKGGFDMLVNLLSWAKSQAGSMAFLPEKINFSDLVEKNLSNLKEFATNKKINLIYNIEEDFEVVADKNILTTVLRNLINNALKYTPSDGEVVVSIMEEGDSVVVQIKDNGVGIKESDFKKLFRTDMKFSLPGTNYEGGTGLGLILCKELVEKQNGKIWVESEFGKGSTFYFTIPAMIAEPKQVY